MAKKTRKRDVFFGILESMGEALAEEAAKEEERRKLARHIVSEQNRQRQERVFVCPPPMPTRPGYKRVIKRTPGVWGEEVTEEWVPLGPWD